MAEEIRIVFLAEILEQDEANAQGKSEEAKIAEAENSSAGVGKTIAINMASRAGQYAFSNYGYLTGDNTTQSNVQTTIEWGGIAGMAVFGGLAGIAVSAGTVGLKIADYAIDQRIKKADLEFFKERVGISGRSH